MNDNSYIVLTKYKVQLPFGHRVLLEEQDGETTTITRNLYPVE